ncbi:isocitrate lyase/PEP mutase family protein [Hoeflea prorocentri]|uniref:Isocitrate lyase/phosphoenolpyruvate mutase family protein n=1 Tax=Hoeflea prorocentri TaxID=1922333 RepID=A0A9X3ZH77_9HYPH|nr:isocitrate lyase/phosphoenolpyruvate mutase family protein [Hoeflea prorocentri]MCY6380999.1 isocitrate lyase/phosphoenolpyruvate mutase family protein [Hoeflea prorocentri]MDA5398799.1 isocitrate lyase/phosphoenolpyruvate mutase family protein [Hoeflea prorocentri]
MNTEEKFERFKTLHQGEGAFIIANPWNAGSAIILEQLGFEALATTSAGLAFATGRCDGRSQVTREDALSNARDIASATSLPVSADLEGGFGDLPEDCAETISLAMETGLVGGSIEDATGRPEAPIYEFGQAVERVAASAEAARGQPFLLTARAENFLYGRPDLDDTIRRLQAFDEAGADVLFAPGLPDLEAVRLVCSSVSKPVNVVMGLTGANWSLNQLAEAGVKRVSVGGSFARAALGGLIRAANEVRERGTFTYAVEALTDAEARRFMEAGRR